MKVKKIQQKLNREFKDAENCQRKHKKMQKNLFSDIKAVEQELRNNLQKEGKKKKRKYLKQQLQMVDIAYMMLK